jgi:hypothetical protein
MASSLPINILVKHKHQIHQLEALLFGQSGLLDHRFREDYPKMLKKEYQFLRKKYGLSPVHLPVFFLRMRPRNFPTIRLAQLAMLINRSEHLFSEIREASSINVAKKMLNVTANDYWHYHYRFDEKGEFNKKRVGSSMVDNIIINTIVPMLYTYGSYYQQLSIKEKALRWLEESGSENNSICKGFVGLGLQNKNAWDSQAFIQLKTEYCNKKRCLDCSVGSTLLKTNAAICTSYT